MSILPAEYYSGRSSPSGDPRGTHRPSQLVIERACANSSSPRPVCCKSHDFRMSSIRCAGGPEVLDQRGGICRRRATRRALDVLLIRSSVSPAPHVTGVGSSRPALEIAEPKTIWVCGSLDREQRFDLRLLRQRPAPRTSFLARLPSPRVNAISMLPCLLYKELNLRTSPATVPMPRKPTANWQFGFSSLPADRTTQFY